ncbi:hypothetical protein [Dyadobacter luticola]|uniref:Uncharacterized protein n=1 Tax=Dyadobacter luticola TaxID=1979387 RepID=A0A5R9KW52_9BACT|nr:hypothetical protein [Dyadobacter luticola]TLV00307.1 hypothetical protein FEN17_12455 [Dyadobacter luticola]
MNSDLENQNEEVRDPEVAKALAKGRNANDNFNDEKTDDYQDEADLTEQQARDRIKGGTGQHGVERNRNDDFNDEANAE